MTSWFHFIFHSAPWYARIIFGLLLPVWINRANKSWKFVGGWTQRYRGRPAIGIKSLPLLEETDRSIGKLIWVEESDQKKKVEHFTCHEMTHAFSASLRLPLWLNEGIAMITVDEYFGMPTVRSETLYLLSQEQRRSVASYQNLVNMKNDEIAYNYVRGYWITRFLMDTNPELLKEVLQKGQNSNSIEKLISSTLNINNIVLQEETDRLAFEYFKKKLDLGEQGAVADNSLRC